MDLVEKYLGEMKFSDYKEPEKLGSVKDFIKDLEDIAKLNKGRKGDITANISWAMKNNDKKRVQMLIDKFAKDILGGQGTVNQIMMWIKGQWK